MNASPALFAPSLGLYAFSAAKGHGSFVTFSLTATPHAPSEECYIWIYMCGWRIRESTQELAHSESSDGEIESAVSRLNGARLNELAFHACVTPRGLRHAVSLNFDEILSMKLYQYEECSPDAALIRMCDAAGTWVSYLADGSIQTDNKA